MGYGRKSEIRDGREMVFCSHCKQFKDVAEFNLSLPPCYVSINIIAVLAKLRST